MFNKAELLDENVPAVALTYKMLLGEETTREGEKKERDGLVSFTASSKRLLFSPSSSSSSSMDGEVPPPVPTEEPLLDFIPVESPEADVPRLGRPMKIMIASTSSHLVPLFKLWISRIKSLSRQALPS
ncbi:hypothetical protein OIU85_022642 [Salix viminalis]|uniref:Uncharacterized protein n=1 Tax=Salix viminalis TaxID=40686 RepID=A0A9Q0U7C6_SALVM|nr:hypothetical protein OIU85_022642 [Salix viminalis]